ncbi:MAG: hypothetical protein GY795_12310 [Desulfobacterales bacterium]|nr:hypothetical protein [Desulfobacterales bacterium]
MIPENIASFLRYPFYKLYYIDDLDYFDGLSQNEVAAIRNEYNSQIITGIIAALQWVTEHPEADLTVLVPRLSHSNAQLHRYAKIVLQGMA